MVFACCPIFLNTVPLVLAVHQNLNFPLLISQTKTHPRIRSDLQECLHACLAAGGCRCSVKSCGSYRDPWPQTRGVKGGKKGKTRHGDRFFCAWSCVCAHELKTQSSMSNEGESASKLWQKSNSCLFVEHGSKKNANKE